MEQSEIKIECELMYAQLRGAEARLKTLREICKHPTTFRGNWSWRPGASQPADICSDCGTCVKMDSFEIPEVKTINHD